MTLRKTLSGEGVYLLTSQSPSPTTIATTMSCIGYTVAPSVQSSRHP